MLALALPLSFFLVMLETAIGSFIVLFLLDVYGGVRTARLVAAANTSAGSAEFKSADEEANASPKALSTALAEKRGGVTKGFLVFQGLLYLLLALLTFWFGSVFATTSVFDGVKGF